MPPPASFRSHVLRPAFLRVVLPRELADFFLPTECRSSQAHLPSGGRRLGGSNRSRCTLGGWRWWIDSRRRTCDLRPVLPPSCSRTLALGSALIALSIRAVYNQEFVLLSRAPHQPLGRRHSLLAPPRRSIPSSRCRPLPVRPPRPHPSRRSPLRRRRQRRCVAVPRRPQSDGLRLPRTWDCRTEPVEARDEPARLRGHREQAVGDKLGGGESVRVLLSSPPA